MRQTKRQFSYFVLLICISWFTFFFIRLPHLIWHATFLFSWFMSKGLIFYKDFIYSHFPTSAFLTYPIFKITNWNPETGPFIIFFVSVFTLVVIYKLGRKFLTDSVTIASMLYFSLFFYYLTTGVQFSMEAVSGLFLVLSLYFLIKIERRQNKINLVLFGIFMSASSSFSIISIPVNFFLLCVGFYFIYKKRFNCKKILYILAGFLPIPFLIFLYLLVNKALGDFFYQNIGYYFIYFKLAKQGNNYLELPWKDILMLYWSLFLFPIYWKKPLFKILFFSSLISIPTMLLSVFHPHHFLYMLPLISLFSGLVLMFIFENKSLLNKFLFSVISIFLLIHIFLNILPWYTQKIKSDGKLVNTISQSDPAYVPALWIKNNTDKNSSIIVVGDSLVYYSADRLPSSKYSLNVPYYYRPIEEIAPKIRKELPDYWVVSDSYLDRLSSEDGWDSPEVANWIREELDSDYKKVANFPDWEIWGKINSF